MVQYMVILLVCGSLLACGDNPPPPSKDKAENPVDSQQFAEHQQSSSNFPQKGIEPDTASTPKDTSFVEKAIQSNRLEIKMAEMALQRSSNDEVKRIATRLRKDHQQLLNQLKKLSDLPDSLRKANPLAGQHSMQELSGAAFDKQWVEEMITKHQETIQSYGQVLNSDQPPAVKKYISGAIPTIQEHLQQLKTCRTRLP